MFLISLTCQHKVSIKYLDVCELPFDDLIFDNSKEIKGDTGATKHERITNASLEKEK
jgi:hypothetical protein